MNGSARLGKSEKPEPASGPWGLPSPGPDALRVLENEWAGARRRAIELRTTPSVASFNRLSESLTRREPSERKVTYGGTKSRERSGQASRLPI